MSPHDPDSSVGHSFGLEIDDVTIKGISEASGLTLEQDVVEFHEGEGALRLEPGRPRAGEVTFARPLTEDTGFERWVGDVRSGKRGRDIRPDVAVVIHDREGTAIKRYRLTNAWPTKLEIGTLVQGGTTMLVENLTIAFEEMGDG